MTTKTLQARNLHAGDHIVTGGDGKPRVAHKVCEFHLSPERVTCVVAVGEVFETRTFGRREDVRIRTDV